MAAPMETWRPARIVGASPGLIALWLALALTFGGCDEPCVELEHTVCSVVKDNRRCEIMQEQDRRALLSDDACQSILESIARR